MTLLLRPLGMFFIYSSCLICDIQIAATMLIYVCQRIGPDFTVSHVMPQLKELFEELAFSQEAAYGPSSSGRNLKVSRSKSDEDVQIESRLDLL